MTRDEFYERFPWVIQLPIPPQCGECLLSSGPYNVEPDGWHWTEYHYPTCSRYDHHCVEHVIPGPCPEKKP